MNGLVRGARVQHKYGYSYLLLDDPVVYQAFDHLVTGESYDRMIAYVLNEPSGTIHIVDIPVDFLRII